MKERKKNHCTICNAIIPRSRKICEICENTYPCQDCKRKDKATCLCKKWKMWFSLQWRKFYRGNKKQKNPESAELLLKNEEKPSE